MTRGELIRKHRIKTDLTQTKLAAMRGYGYKTALGWEADVSCSHHRNPSFEDFLWLGRLFGEEFRQDLIDNWHTL